MISYCTLVLCGRLYTNVAQKIWLQSPSCCCNGRLCTHTTHNHFTALWIFSGTTWVSWYQKKHSPTYTYHDHQSFLIYFIYYDPWHPPCSSYMSDSLFVQSIQLFFGLPLGLAPSTSYSIHFVGQSLSSFRSTCPYHRNLFYCSSHIMSSNPSLSALYL